MNGIRIPSPEDTERKVSLDVIPSFLLGSIELSKALTPDMDGDAIGGSVNLITKNGFDYDGRTMNLKITGGQRSMRGKNNSMAAFNYADQLMDNKLDSLFPPVMKIMICIRIILKWSGMTKLNG